MPAAASLEEPKGEPRKLPQYPETVFEKVLLPKLQAGQPLDLPGSLAEWVPVHLKRCPEATYDALKAECKTITAAYDSLSIYGLAEHRPKEAVRLMLKVKGPNGKVCQAGSHASPSERLAFALRMPVCTSTCWTCWPGCVSIRGQTSSRPGPGTMNCV